MRLIQCEMAICMFSSRVTGVGKGVGGGSFFEGWDDVELGDEAPLPTMRMFVSVGITTIVCMCYYINTDP